jgi:hypothetical protein
VGECCRRLTHSTIDTRRAARWWWTSSVKYPRGQYFFHPCHPTGHSNSAHECQLLQTYQAPAEAETIRIASIRHVSGDSSCLSHEQFSTRNKPDIVHMHKETSLETISRTKLYRQPRTRSCGSAAGPGCLGWCVRLILLITLLPITMGAIIAGSVLLTPSGVLQMTASWNDSPQTGATYNVFILTTFRNPPSSTIHKKLGLTTSIGESVLVIGESNKGDFVAGNPSTDGTFPGFQIGQLYRIYIEYFSSSGEKLNSADDSAELSSFSTPMIKASSPLAVASCGILEHTNAPCHEIQPLPFSIRVHWNMPLSRYEIISPLR